MAYPKRVFLIDDDEDDCLIFNLALDGLSLKVKDPVIRMVKLRSIGFLTQARQVRILFFLIGICRNWMAGNA